MIAWEEISTEEKKKFAKSLGIDGINQTIKRFMELALTGLTKIPCAACENATEVATSRDYGYDCHTCAYPEHKKVDSLGRCTKYLRRLSNGKKVEYPTAICLLRTSGHIAPDNTNRSKKNAIDWCLAVARDYEGLKELL